MGQKTLTFRLKEKSAKDFINKCKNKERTYYSVLQELAKKYTNGTLKLTAQDDKIQALKFQIDELKRAYKLKIENLQERNNDLIAQSERMNIQNDETYRLTKRIFAYALARNSKQNAKELTDKELNLALKVVHKSD